MYEASANLQTVLSFCAEDLCFGVAAHANGDVFARAGERHRLPFPDFVDAALRPDAIVSRYEECEGARWHGGPPRGYARERLSSIVGIPRPGVLLILFGLMPESVAAALPDSDARIAWYWAHRRRVWSTVEAAYARCAA